MLREKKKFLILIVFTFLFPLFLFILFLKFPKLEILEECQENQSVRIYDRNGILLYETLSDDSAKTVWNSTNSIPPLVEGAVIASEDKRFFKHCGIDPFALLRAFWIDIKSFSIKQGGSTITQQTAKLMIKRKGRNIFLKLYEFFYALKLESQFNKKEILSIYLNKAPYGKNIVGIRKAAEVYFNSPLENLTPAQIAYLSAIPKAPSYYDPVKNFSFTKRKQEKILERMKEQGYISDDEYKKAVEERITIENNLTPFKAPHFVERVKEDIKERKEKSFLTTIDESLMREISYIIDTKRQLLEKIGAKNVAVIVIENKSGEVLAWEGSGNYFSNEEGGKIDGIITPRQPGSALKPFLYALAFERGFLPSSVLPDIPSTFPTSKEGAYYSPRNYDNKFRGPLSARKALAGSINVPAIYLISKIGVENFLNTLRNGGITTLDKSPDFYGVGIALGNGEVKLCELTNLYATLSRGGAYREISKFLGERSSQEKRVFSEEASFLVTDILSDNRAREFSFGRNNWLEFTFKVAAKTGTSEGYHDNFAFGYNKDITVGVWVGNFDRKPLKYSSGVSGAGPIFHQVFIETIRHLRGVEPQPFEEILTKPSTLEKIEVCSISGLSASENCLSKNEDYVYKEKELKKCNWHRKYGKKVVTIYPENYKSWAKEMGLWQDKEQELFEITEDGSEKFKIISPMNEAVFLYDPTIPKKYQGVYLETLGGEGKIKWSIDRKEFVIVDKGERAFLEFSKGEHIIQAKDEKNQMAVCKITVR